MTERFRLVPAVYVLFRRTTGDGEEVLLQLRQHTGFMDGFWAHAAAGHVELGESVFTAGAREAAEELGVTVEAADLVPLTVLHRRYGDGAQDIDHRVDFFLECRTWSGEPRLMEPDKAADLRWWPIDALPTPLVEHESFVIDGCRTGELPRLAAMGF
ncbi:NUDIX hydrolase [Nocardia cyriacigeorgica]|uniref:NUDIX hydrolase n=1 Tax=Nocardia cyriacigeorgica TaxID=135487 RepID=UPI0024545AF9|nr:NUDIX domain-containing protein [Nocardia cyriacigeorgica]